MLDGAVVVGQDGDERGRRLLEKHLQGEEVVELHAVHAALESGLGVICGVPAEVEIFGIVEPCVGVLKKQQ